MVKKKQGFSLKYTTPATRLKCTEEYFAQHYGSSSNETLLLFNGPGYEDTELKLKYMIREVGDVFTCQMIVNSEVCSDVISKLSKANNQGAFWGFILLNEEK